MANKRIGETTNRTATESTDKFPFERSSAMNHINQSDLYAEIQTLIDNSIGGTTDKIPVRVASTANASITVAPSSIDGVTLVSGDRVLLKDQSSGTQNGIRIFTAAGAALLRSSDANASDEVKANMIVSVEEGTVNGSTKWMLVTNNPIVLDTNNLVFAEYYATIANLALKAPLASPTFTVSLGIFNLTLKYATASKTMAGGATEVIPVQVPSGAKILGCQLRNDIVVTGAGATTYDSAYSGGGTQPVSSGTAFAANTKVNQFFNETSQTNITTNITNITLTPNAGTLDSGMVTAVVYYYELTSLP